MAILNLEEIDGSLDLDVKEQSDTVELPLEEMQEVQEDTQALEDATDLLQDMEEAAQQQAVTINNIEGNASEINSVEDGEEEVPSVEPEFTQDDIENNPEMVQDIVNEQQAAMEAFAVRITGKTGKSMRNQLLGYFGINPVSHESIRVNPYEAYKITHEGLKETIQAVIKKIKHWILGLGQKLKALYNKFRVWMANSKKQEKQLFENLEKGIKEKTILDLDISETASKHLEFAGVVLGNTIQYTIGNLVYAIEKKDKFPDVTKGGSVNDLVLDMLSVDGKGLKCLSLARSGKTIKLLIENPEQKSQLMIKTIEAEDSLEIMSKHYAKKIVSDGSYTRMLETNCKEFESNVNRINKCIDSVNKKIEELDKKSVKASEEELKTINSDIKRLSVIGTFLSILFNANIKSYTDTIKVLKFLTKEKNKNNDK